MSEIEDTSPSSLPLTETDQNVLGGLRSTGSSILLTALLLTVFFALGLGVGYLVWGQDRAALVAQVENLQARAEAAEAILREAGISVNPQAAAQDPNAPRQVVRYDISEGDSPSYGSADAPITIIEFSDYECPYCTRWHMQVWPRLLENYADKIRLVYRDFPLYSIHPNAGPAAEAAHCAGEQNNYWPFHELLFVGGEGLSRSAYLSYAGQLNLDMAAFTACLDEKRYAALVEASFEYARQLGVQSTPTFFINGIALIGAQPYEVFQEIIELELAGKLSK